MAKRLTRISAASRAIAIDGDQRHTLANRDYALSWTSWRDIIEWIADESASEPPRSSVQLGVKDDNTLKDIPELTPLSDRLTLSITIDYKQNRE